MEAMERRTRMSVISWMQGRGEFTVPVGRPAATKLLRENVMPDNLSDRHALLARTEALAREIEELSSSDDMTPDMRRRVAELKILHQELSARLQAMDRSQ
jgi:hypothetical protein